MLVFAKGGLVFEGEMLSFSLTRSKVPGELLWDLDGSYYFSNPYPEPVSANIAFPVPSSDSVSVAELQDLSLQEPPDSSSVSLLSSSDSGFAFTLTVPAKEFINLRLRYRQVLTGKEVTYILTTANAWGRKLPYSGISLYLEEGLELSELPFEDARSFEGLIGTSYLWDMVDFAPEKEFVVRIK